MRVNADNLLLVGAELLCIPLDACMSTDDQSRQGDKSYLESYQHGMRSANQTNGGRSLLDGFQGIFDLEDATLGRAAGNVRISLLRGQVAREETYKVTESLS